MTHSLFRIIFLKGKCDFHNFFHKVKTSDQIMFGGLTLQNYWGNSRTLKFDKEIVSETPRPLNHRPEVTGPYYCSEF